MHEFRFCAFVSKGAKRIKSTDGRAKGEALTDLYIKKKKKARGGHEVNINISIRYYQ